MNIIIKNVDTNETLMHTLSALIPRTEYYSHKGKLYKTIKKGIFITETKTEVILVKEVSITPEVKTSLEQLKKEGRKYEQSSTVPRSFKPI